MRRIFSVLAVLMLACGGDDDDAGTPAGTAGTAGTSTAGSSGSSAGGTAGSSSGSNGTAGGGSSGVAGSSTGGTNAGGTSGGGAAGSAGEAGSAGSTAGTSGATSGTAGDGGAAGTAGASAGNGGMAGNGGNGGTGGFDPAHAPSTLGGTTVGSTGCAMPNATTGVQTVSLTVDGSMRSATVFVPDDYNPETAYPVVFVFHGDGGTGAGIRSGLNLEPDAAGKAIFAYPDGANQTWDDDVNNTNHDMNLVMSLRDQLRSQYCVDTHRTFATGMSRGGFFVNQLSCRYGIAEFAAVAPHSSTIDPGQDGAYIYGPPNPNGGPFMEDGNYDFACPSDGSPPPQDHPVLPAPTMVIHGECDNEGGVEFPQGRRVAEHWGFAAQCDTTPAVEVTTSPNPTCSGALTNNPTLSVDPCYVAPGCTSGHEITFCAIPSMGHSVWADAHSHIWSFFAAH